MRLVFPPNIFWQCDTIQSLLTVTTSFFFLILVWRVSLQLAPLQSSTGPYLAELKDVHLVKEVLSMIINKAGMKKIQLNSKGFKRSNLVDS